MSTYELHTFAILPQQLLNERQNVILQAGKSERQIFLKTYEHHQEITILLIEKPEFHIKEKQNKKAIVPHVPVILQT